MSEPRLLMLVQLLADPENQPHQYVDDDYGLLLEIRKGIREIVPDTGCPNWGKKPGRHYGACGTCAWCRIFTG